MNVELNRIISERDKDHGDREGSDGQGQAGDLGWGGHEGLSERSPRS